MARARSKVGSKLVEQFSQNLRQLIAEDGAAGGNAAATTTDEADGGTSTGQAAAEAGAGAAGTSQDGPGSTQPSPVVPPAATTATAPPPAASADSINLIKLVGPSLLKRVVPAVVAAAGLALFGRWLFRRNAKG